MNLKRPLLYVLVGAVIFGAVLGIVLVLRNSWGDFEIRVLLTTFTIAIASLCGLACDFARTPRGANHLPYAGLLLTFVTASMILCGIWARLENEAYWKGTACVSIFAVATTHTCLLSIMRLAGRFQWVYLVACQVIFGLAILLSVMIVWEIDNERMIRIVVTISIIDAALTLVIPLLHRISKSDAASASLKTPLEERNVAAVDEEIARLRKRILELEKLKSELTGGVTEKGSR